MTNYRKIKVIAFTICVAFGLFIASWRVITVSAQSTVKDQYLPPYMIADLYVNVSSAYLDKSVIISSQINENDLSIQQSQKSIKMAISSLYSVEEYERGWVFLHVSLNAKNGEAKISPTIVSNQDLENNNIFKMGNLNIQKLDSYFTVPVEYPSLLTVAQENQTLEKPRISWDQFYEEKMSLTNFLDERDYVLETDRLPYTFDLFESFESGEVEEPAIEFSESSYTSAEEFEIKEFEVSRNLFQTVFTWVVETLGIEAQSGEEAYIKSIFGDQIEIETTIPYRTETVKDYPLDDRLFDDRNVNALVYIQEPTIDLSNPAKPQANSIISSLKEATRGGRPDPVKAVLTDMSGTAISGVSAQDITFLNTNGIDQTSEVNTTITNGKLGFFSLIDRAVNYAPFIIAGLGVVAVVLIGAFLIINSRKGNRNEN